MNKPMQDLIEALTIFGRHQDSRVLYPTECSNALLWIVGVKEDGPSEEEKKRLADLGFEWCDEDFLAPAGGAWCSYRFGSA